MLIVSNKAMIFAVFLKSLPRFNKISKPKPAPDESPAITEPKLITPFKYINVISTETAQFGIKPKIPTITG